MSFAPPVDSAKRRPRRRHRSGRTIAAAGSRAIGIALVLALLWLTYDLPYARLYVAAALAICALTQVVWPNAWLVFLPALLPVFDLTLWSGRLYVDEFDLLVLTTAAVHYLTAPEDSELPHFRGKGGILVIALLISIGIAALIGAFPLALPDANQLGTYLSNYNALRVAKSFLWGLLLLAPLQSRLAENPARAAALLIVGTSVGLSLVGIAVLWERGVFLALAQSSGHLYANRYAILGAFLDFTSNHRATALFSEMHTGGEAIDTYLAVAPPVAAAGVLGLRRPTLRLFCVVALCLGIYAVVATFSRGLYFGFAAGMISVLLLATFTSRHRFRSRFVGIRIVCGIVASFATLALAYAYGGFDSLALGLLVAALAVLAAHFIAGPAAWRSAAALGVIFALGAPLLAHTFLHSHYNHLAPMTAWYLGALSSALLVGGAALAAFGTIAREDRLSAVIVFLLFSALAGIAIPASGGTRMLDRFAESSDDAHDRWEHWSEAWRLMGPDWQEYAFGMGLGRYPQIYFRRSMEGERSANYRFASDGPRSWLEWGSGDFTLAQKIPFRPATDYVFNVSVRSKTPNARLDVYMCPKLVLYGKDDEPTCQHFWFQVQPENAWTAHEVSFNSGKVGADGILGWPMTLILHNDVEDSVIDVTDIRLSDGRGNIVANGNFAAGGDRWLLVDDIEHLPYHIKNLYLEVLFEAGAVGLFLLVAAGIVAFVNAVRAARRHDPLGVGVVGALVAFACVGAFGSLFDNPRPATLFVLFLLWALQPAAKRAFLRRESGAQPVESSPVA